MLVCLQGRTDQHNAIRFTHMQGSATLEGDTCCIEDVLWSRHLDLIFDEKIKQVALKSAKFHRLNLDACCYKRKYVIAFIPVRRRRNFFSGSEHKTLLLLIWMVGHGVLLRGVRSASREILHGENVSMGNGTVPTSAPKLVITLDLGHKQNASMKLVKSQPLRLG